jgi:hypothetical protein
MTDAFQPRDLDAENGRATRHDAVVPSRCGLPAREPRARVMRCISLLLFGLTLSSPGFAMDSRWTVLHEDAAGGDYIDLGSVQRTDGVVDVWLLSDYVAVRRIQGVRNSASNSALVKVRIDCAARRSGILALELRAGRGGEGDVVFQHSPETLDMVAVQSDPAMLKAVELACGAGSVSAASARTGQR